MPDEMLICRSCKVAAEVVHRNGEIVRIGCSACGVLIESDIARHVYREQTRYFAIKKAQDALARGFRGSQSVSYRKATVRDPGGPFIIGKPNE